MIQQTGLIMSLKPEISSQPKQRKLLSIKPLFLRVRDMRLLRIILCFLCATALVCCATISGKLPPPGAPVASGEFRVGAAKVDITPMPGYPMGGYAVAGHISRGVWMRLQARVVCFEDAYGESLAMVSADLWAVPAGFADRVAELVARKHGVLRLAREQIVVAATHTHNGPGNFTSSYLYNEMASPKTGFDRKLFEFLAHRIAGAIAEAWEKRQPAVLRYGETVVFGVSRNRSLDAFQTNGTDALELIESNRGYPIRATTFRIGGDDAYRAVDPTLRVIRAETTTEPRQLLAIAAFFAVHPTVMDTTTEVYNSDIFGIATSQVERSLAAASPHSPSPVVAIFNGAEGDVAANWRRRDRPEAIALGTMLADGIQRVLHAPGEDITGRIAGNFGQSQLSDLATPLSGASTLCGAEGDWTFLHDAGFHEGMTQQDPKKQVEGQGVKRNPAEDDIQSPYLRDLAMYAIRLILKPPRAVPIGVYRIGPVVMGTLPGEFTTVLGRRIGGAIQKETPGAKHVLLVGLANEYMSYFSTEEEYALQTYEASSMMYGPRAGTRIRDDLAALARDLGRVDLRKKELSYRYDVGPTARFGVEEFDLLSHQERLITTHNTLATVLIDAEHDVPVPDHPRFIWIERSPSWPRNPAKPGIVMPSVAIEVKQAGAWVPLKVAGVPENDRGENFVTTVVASLLGDSRWLTIWLLPRDLEKDPLLSSAEFRFVVNGFSGVIHSPPFTLASARERWGLTGIAREH
jgi:neutral ceramidase